MNRFAIGAVVLIILMGPAARAAIIVDSTISAQFNGSSYDYSIVLTNTAASTVNIGTFWFAWIPAQDYLKTSPLSVTSPAGWVGAITHVPNVATNGYAIQWVAGGTGAAFNPALAITPGNSLTFGFRSTDTPAEVFGNSIFFNNPPVLTSFVYQGAPFSGEALQFVVRSVPEPSSLALAGFGALGVAAATWRRRRSRRPVEG